MIQKTFRAVFNLQIFRERSYATVLSSRQLFFLALVAFLVSRLIILIGIYGGANIQISSHSFRNSFLSTPQLDFSFHALGRAVNELWELGDSYWYRKIAAHGYASRPFDLSKQENWAFFPLLPLLMRVAVVAKLDPIIFAGVFANIFFVIALWQLGLFLQGLKLAFADIQFSIWALALFPASYFVSAPVTESLFLLLSIGILRMIQLDLRPGIAIGLFFLCLTRVTGVLILPAIILYAWNTRKYSTTTLVCFVISALAAIVLFATYLGFTTGNPFAFLMIQQKWGRDPFMLSGPKIQIFSSSIFDGWSIPPLQTFSLLLSLLAGAFFFHKKHWHWLIYLLIPVVITIGSGSLLSLWRFILVLPPLFWGLSLAIQNTSLRIAVLATFAALLAFVSVLLGLHGVSVLAEIVPNGSWVNA